MKMLRPLCCLCLALAAPVGAVEEQLGRLFFSPQERAELEHDRDSGRSRARNQAHQEPPPIPRQVYINGLVRRSNGQSTVWINGSTDPHPGLQPDVPAADGAIPIQLHDGINLLKPGQRLATESGTVTEGFNAGR